MGRDGGSEEGEAGVAVLPSASSILPHHHHHHHHAHHHAHHHGQQHHHQEREREDSSSSNSSSGGDDGQHDGHKKRSRSRSPSPRANVKEAAGSPSKPRVAPAADAAAAAPAAPAAAPAAPAIKKAKPSAAPLSFGDELGEEEAGVAHVKRSMDEVTTARLAQEQREQLKAAKTPAALMGLAPLNIPRGPWGAQAPLQPPQQQGGAKSLQILDDEPDVVGREDESGGGALPPPVCVMQAAHSRGPKAAMEDRHTARLYLYVECKLGRWWGSI